MIMHERDIEKCLEIAKQKYDAACVEMQGAERAVKYYEKLVTDKRLRERGIEMHDQVIVEFEEGPEQCRFEGVWDSTYYPVAKIFVRIIGKSGRLHKHPIHLDVDAIDDIRKAKEKVAVKEVRK